jgi:triosephosphate isomerase
MAIDKKLIIGNWKMNLNMQESSLFLHKLSKLVKNHRDVEVVLAPTLLTLQALSLQVDLKQFKLAAQNFYWRDSGAYTGEVSASQLRGIVQYALVGHSERRHIFNETNKEIRDKVAAAVRNGIRPVLFIGETAWERSSGEEHDVLRDQLVSGLANITSEEINQVVIAYEPVWAIGNGKNALPSDVSAAVATICNQINHLYGAKAAKSIQIIYGGSVSADNAADYLAIPGINGLVVATASLNANTFNEILKKAHKGSSVAKKD